MREYIHPFHRRPCSSSCLRLLASDVSTIAFNHKAPGAGSEERGLETPPEMFMIALSCSHTRQSTNTSTTWPCEENQEVTRAARRKCEAREKQSGSRHRPNADIDMNSVTSSECSMDNIP